VPPPVVVNVNESTSNSPPPEPVNVRYTVRSPDGTPVRAVLTSANVLQPPVFGTATEPSTGPSTASARTWRVPPGPPDTTRAVTPVTPVRSTPG
jgi:hypothetical protein